jgi:hypothetical protein
VNGRLKSTYIGKHLPTVDPIVAQPLIPS